MKKTEPWWVCNSCRRPLVRVGTKHVKAIMFDHRKTCDELATFCIRQVTQTKKDDT